MKTVKLSLILLLALCFQPITAIAIRLPTTVVRAKRRKNRAFTKVAVSANALQVRGGSNGVDSFLNFMDIFGTGVFAFSGALTAGKKGMDLLGMVIIATVTTTGGGTIRDLLLDSGTVFWMRNPIYFEIALVTAIGTYFLWPKLENELGWTDHSRVICLADAFGLGAFAVIGTQKAVERDLKPIMWVVVGVITSTFGGIIRDVICLQRPRSMYPYQSLYAIHPLMGSTLYTILTNRFSMDREKAAIATFLLTSTTRILSFDSPLRLPHWKDVDDN